MPLRSAHQYEEMPDRRFSEGAFGLTEDGYLCLGGGLANDNLSPLSPTDGQKYAVGLDVEDTPNAWSAPTLVQDFTQRGACGQGDETQLLIFGGNNGGTAGNELADGTSHASLQRGTVASLYTPSTNSVAAAAADPPVRRWVYHSSPSGLDSNARVWACATVIRNGNGDLLHVVVGGSNDYGGSNQQGRYAWNDLIYTDGGASWNSATPSIHYPTHGACAFFDGKLWVTGGHEPEGDASWDPATDGTASGDLGGNLQKCTYVPVTPSGAGITFGTAGVGPDLPYDTYNHSMFVLNDHLFWLGNDYTANDNARRVWMLNDDQDDWIEVSPLQSIDVRPGTSDNERRCSRGGATPNSEDLRCAVSRHRAFAHPGRYSTSTLQQSRRHWEIYWVHGQPSIIPAADNYSL